MSFSTFSSLFLDVCFNVDKAENPASQTEVDIRISGPEASSQKGALKQFLKSPFGKFAHNCCFIFKNV